MIPFRLLPRALVLLACHGKIALAAWLLTTHSVDAAVLRWEGTDGGRRASVTVQPSRHVGFTLVDAAQSGASVTNSLREDRHLTSQILLNGSGVAAGDVDGDGWCDLYFCGLDGPNVLLRNRGNFVFEDMTALSGTACAGMDATGAVLADIDGDEDLDLVVNTVGAGTHVFLNDGKGKFSEVKVLNRGRCGRDL